jgi:predicted dehydrogenase
METVRLAVVGFTGYGWSLAQQIAKASAACGCRLVAAADDRMARAPDRVERLRAEGVELFDDALAMYRALAGRCEAVYIATGIASHEPLALAAFDAGFPVHLEKPPAATVQEVDRMVEAMRRVEKFCLVGFQAVHAEDIRLIKQRIVEGRLGRVRTLVCWASWPRGQAYYGRTDWSGKLRVGDRWVLDGPATNALAHQLTNLLLLASGQPDRLAQPAAVRAELYAAAPISGHDTAAIEITTAEDQTATLLVSHCGLEQFGPFIEIQAERGTVRWEYKKGAEITYADGRKEFCAAPADGGRGEMVANFVQAVRRNDGKELRCPLGEARAETAALDGAHESSQVVHRVAPDCYRTIQEDGEKKTGPRVVVDGLDELLVQAARGRCLLSDLPGAPSWAVATKPFDLSGYKSFPQQFRGQ